MNDLVTTIVVTLVLVIVIGSLIFVLAMYWTQILRKFAPNRFSEPMSEKTNQQWPQPPTPTRARSSPISSRPCRRRHSRRGRRSSATTPSRPSPRPKPQDRARSASSGDGQSSRAWHMRAHHQPQPPPNQFMILFFSVSTTLMTALGVIYRRFIAH
ncbi:hypothetical protein PG994_014884 [Apiospora phragmitis]|uniref:Uncharacterized protein n=1 Tax=Apiospora phragmitis TaxID=2905665 RepID=A0ABR1SUW3_9PEZI